jgi:hypothetical protein
VSPDDVTCASEALLSLDTLQGLDRRVDQEHRARRRGRSERLGCATYSYVVLSVSTGVAIYAGLGRRLDQASRMETGAVASAAWGRTRDWAAEGWALGRCASASWTPCATHVAATGTLVTASSSAGTEGRAVLGSETARLRVRRGLQLAYKRETGAAKISGTARTK